MKKSIGKNTLGSGEKMTVDTRHYERSTHDLSYIWRSTMAAGTIVPFLANIGLKGDTWDINLEAHVLTHPTLGPLFGSFKVQLDVFTADMRLYIGKLHNNANNIGLHMEKVKLPIIKMEADNLDFNKDVNNQQINPSCKFKYLGISGLGKAANPLLTEVTREFQALHYLADADIYKNYYANKQEEVGAVIHNYDIPRTVEAIYERTGTGAYTSIAEANTGAPATDELISPGSNMAVNFTGTAPTPEDIEIVTNNGTYSLRNMYDTFGYNGLTILEATNIKNEFIGLRINFWQYTEPTKDREPNIVYFPLENIDTMREDILAATKNSAAFIIDKNSIAPYGLPLKKEGEIWSKATSQEGLFLKTYQSDIFNNWISTEWLDGENGINAVTAIDTSDGNFTIDTLTIKRKIYNMLNAIAISGGTYYDWLEVNVGEAVWGVAEIPVYEGGLSKELIFQEVVSNSATSAEGGQPLGTLAGRGVLSKKHKGGYVRIKPHEHTLVMGNVSITPRLDYSQGNEWFTGLKTMDDFHKPALDGIGFQDLITGQMAYWEDTMQNDGTWVQFSAGKQPAWLNYQTNYNKVFGNFAIEDDQMFMVLNRRYEQDASQRNIKDLTTYIDPVKFNHIFAYQKRDAQNFWVQIGVNIEVRRKMSANQMPIG